MRLLRTLGITMLGMALLPGIAQAEVAWKLRSETSIPLRLADYCMASYAPNGQQSLRLARNSLGQMAILFTPDDPANWRTANASPVQILLGKKLLRQANAIIAANGEVNLPLGREEKWLSEITDQPLTFKQGSASQTYQLPNLNSVTTQLRTCINSAWAQQPDTGGLPSAIEPVLRQASWPDAHILLDKSDKNNEKYLIKSQDSYVRLSSLRSRETLDNLLLSKIDPLEPQCRGYFQFHPKPASRIPQWYSRQSRIGLSLSGRSNAGLAVIISTEEQQQNMGVFY